jgi:TMEM175 potassium channel family protein
VTRRDADLRDETSRVEAFSDGVFAIAMTLLILEIRTPEHLDPGLLWPALFALWPSYLAFLTSFFTIGVMWMNHHRLFNLIGRSDQGLLVANLLLLLFVTFIPFPTAVLARFLGHSDANIAAVLYNAVFLGSALAFQLLWRHSSGQNRLLEEDADPESVEAITRQYRFGPLLYVVFIAIAWFAPTTSLLLNLALAVFFAIPSRRFKPHRSGSRE